MVFPGNKCIGLKADEEQHYVSCILTVTRVFGNNRVVSSLRGSRSSAPKKRVERILSFGKRDKPFRCYSLTYILS